MNLHSHRAVTRSPTWATSAQLVNGSWQFIDAVYREIAQLGKAFRMEMNFSPANLRGSLFPICSSGDRSGLQRQHPFQLSPSLRREGLRENALNLDGSL